MSISRATFLLAIVAASLVTTAVKADDLAATVANKLRDSGAMKGYRVNVKAKSGTVWLEGTVSEPRQIEAAVAAAENVAGVERVVNRLTIGEQAPSVVGGSFSLPSSVRARAGLPAAAEPEPSEAAPAAEESAAIQLTQAVVDSRPVKAASRPGTNQKSKARTSTAKSGGPRPLGAPIARPMQPPRTAGRQQAVRTSARQPMTMPVPAEYPNQMMGDPVVDGGGYQAEGFVGDGQMVPGSMRMTEGPMGGVNCPPGQGGGMGPAGALDGMGGRPMPMGAMGPGGPGGGMGGAGGMPVPVRGNGPNMPNYAWPSYAASPNYAAVQYPTQYSPTAWPYIGPFYPYPQVPLGWRRVSLEWDDGWWWLDFDERHIHSHHR